MCAWWSMYSIGSAGLVGAECALAIEFGQQVGPRVAEQHLDLFHAPLGLEQRLQRLIERLQAEVILGIVDRGAVESIQKGRDVQDLGAMLDEVLLNELLLRKRRNPTH